MQHTPRSVLDQTLKATDGILIVDGKKKVGTQLQRCLDVAKHKPKTAASEPYGTICTR